MKRLFTRIYHQFCRITISYHFSFIPVIWLDPIEQYDLGLFTLWGLVFYPGYLHLIFIFIMFCLLTKQLKLNIFGYAHYKLYKFLRDVYISVFGFDKQLLFPYFYYIFIFILLSNLTGMLPWAFTVTAQLTIAFFFSITSLGGITILSIEQKGWKFFELFKPTAPKPLEHFLIIIEFVSFLIRFISLGVRLFANMVAGHALLKILLLFLALILNSLNAFAVVGGVVGFFIILAVVALELLIAFLQAYVFVFLMLIYTKEML